MHNTVFSPDRRYRYWLQAQLSDEDGICMFLMLNPSRADEVRSDPTVTRCKGFAREWGYGALWVYNLFALRSPDPGALRDDPDPVGPNNDEDILRGARVADLIVCAWGNHGIHLDRSAQVLRMLETEGLSDKMRHLGMTKLNQPRHPLFTRADTQLIYF